MPEPLSIHTIMPMSRANGPGRRLVVWTQGCTIGCPGCINPATHETAADTKMSSDEILALVTEEEGLTISGGEPMQQAAAVADLLEKAQAAGLGTLVYTGYTWLELDRAQRGEVLPNPLRLWDWTSVDLDRGLADDYRRVIAATDIMVLGRYAQAERVRKNIPLLSSYNQEIRFLSERYTRKDLRRVPRMEVVIDLDTGKGLSTGHR